MCSNSHVYLNVVVTEICNEQSLVGTIVRSEEDVFDLYNDYAHNLDLVFVKADKGVIKEVISNIWNNLSVIKKERSVIKGRSIIVILKLMSLPIVKQGHNFD